MRQARQHRRFVSACFREAAPLAAHREGPASAATMGASAHPWPLRRPANATMPHTQPPAPIAQRPDKILVIDDDERIRDLLRRYLTQQGFVAVVADGGTAMDRILQREGIDLIVLDLMMPGEDGLTICRRLRSAGNRTPIIMLTAKGDEMDRIIGLELGADDYLAKPFNPRELLARIHAVLRRRPATEVPGGPSIEDELVRFGAFELDLGQRTLRKNGADIALTTGEFSMLKALVRHPRITLSRERLAQLARGREFEAFDRSLDVQISRLRKLIETDPANPRHIQTVWGAGYVFIPDERD